MRYLDDYWKDVSEVIKTIPNIQDFYGKRVLITGASGMVCSAIVDCISYMNKNRNAGIELIIAGRSEEKLQQRFKGVLANNEYKFMFFDANQPLDIDITVDYIIHGAGNANPAIYSAEPVETLLGNVDGLKSMLEVARFNNGSRLLYVSSSEVYGNKSENATVAFEENDYGYIDIMNPRACYPNGKRVCETLCACYEKEYGENYVTVRLGHIYGPSITKKDTRATAQFTRSAAAGEDILMKSAGSQLRSYCYTLDCASAMLTVLINGKKGNAYNISNKGSIVSIRDIANEFAKAGGGKIVFENPSDEEKNSYNMMINSSLNSEKLEQLGWKAIFDLKEGVYRTLRYFDN